MKALVDELKNFKERRMVCKIPDFDSDNLYKGVIETICEFEDRIIVNLMIAPGRFRTITVWRREEETDE